MKKRETEISKTKLSESTEDPIDIFLKNNEAQNIADSNDENVNENLGEDIFGKYSCIDPKISSNEIKENEEELSSEQKQYNFKITEITENQEEYQNKIAENLQSRKKQKYFYCDLNYFYDKNQAEKEYTKLRYIYAKIISPYTHTIHSKYKNDKYIYVLSIGKFNKFEEARSLCRRLISQNG